MNIIKQSVLIVVFALAGENCSAAIDQLAAGREIAREMLKIAAPSSVDHQIRDGALESRETGEALYRKALQIENNDHSPSKYGQIRLLLEDADTKGCLPARNRLALFWLLGIGGRRDPAVAEVIGLDAFASGCASSLRILARLPGFCERAPQTMSMASLQTFANLANGNNPDALIFLAAMSARSGDRNETQISVLKRAFACGSLDAAIQLTQLWADGKYTPQDSREGAILCCLSIALAPHALNNSAQPIALAGDSVEVTAKMLLTAIENGSPEAARGVGMLLLQMENGGREFGALAAKYLEFYYACGHSEAALMCAKAATLSGDDRIATRWLNAGIRASDWRCQYALNIVESGSAASLYEAIVRAERVTLLEAQELALKAQREGDFVPPLPKTMEIPKVVLPRGRRAGEIIARATIVIDTNGFPARIEIKDCAADIASKLESEIAKWRFQPATKAGVPVPWLLQVTITSAGDELFRIAK